MRLEAVGKRYGLRQPWIVRDVTRDVSAGKLIRLEGWNGSGKSTLLRIAAGSLLPSAGRVTGRPAAGYVPERFPGGLTFSAREYLGHMARIHGLSGHRGVGRGRRVAGAARGGRVRSRAAAHAVKGHVPEGGYRPGTAGQARAARAR